jgi:hypothetical protein
VAVAAATRRLALVGIVSPWPAVDLATAGPVDGAGRCGARALGTGGRRLRHGRGWWWRRGRRWWRRRGCWRWPVVACAVAIALIPALAPAVSPATNAGPTAL